MAYNKGLGIIGADVEAIGCKHRSATVSPEGFAFDFLSYFQLVNIFGLWLSADVFQISQQRQALNVVCNPLRTLRNKSKTCYMPEQPHSLTTMNYFEIAYWVISVFILVATIYYIATGPLNAVKTGRKLNNEQQKDNAKRNLFLTLFALRGSPLNYDFVRALNQIDIVFEDVQPVLDAWHIHYDSLQIKGQVNEDQIWNLQRTNLLSAMAVSLGYNRIRQTDMLQNYYPEGHGHQFREDWELRFAAKEYLKKGVDLYDILIENANRQRQDGQEPQS